MITSQFWIGTAKDRQALQAFMAERDAYYSEENEEAEGTPQHLALSAFAEAMQSSFYDHDFLEYGFAEPVGDLEARFKGHSWVAQWAPIVRESVPEAVLANANVFVMMRIDEAGSLGSYRQIASPADVCVTDIRLHYIGEISHAER